MDNINNGAMEENVVLLCDDEGNETPFVLLSRLNVAGKAYAVLMEQTDEDEEETGVMVFAVEAGDDGEETFVYVEDEDESDEVFYLWQAEAQEYEIGAAE